MPKFLRVTLLILIAALVMSACTEDPEKQEGQVRGRILVDGEERTFIYSQPISVQEVLRLENIILSDLDDVSPFLRTQVQDGEVITVVRVTESTDCHDEVLPFDEERLPRTNLEPGQEIIAEQGVNGRVQVCDLVTYRDGIESVRNQQSRTVIQEAQDAVIYYGVNDTLDPVTIDGTIAYISGGQAWVMETSNSARRPLTIPGDLDGRVFELSPDGRQLLYTIHTTNPDDPEFSNELWLMTDLFTGNVVKLQQIDILNAYWVPGRINTYAYTSATAESGGLLGWTAFNDLWLVEIDSRSGAILNIENIISENVVGTFASWGTQFEWSPDGTNIAYSKADGVGLVDFEAQDFGTFVLNYPFFNFATSKNWVWEPEMSWSEDGQWVTTTVHGPPYGSEAPGDSVVFNVAIFKVGDAENPLILDSFIERAGIWANPTFSPVRADGSVSIAYLQARTPLNSVGTAYDLVVMDRDGSNKVTLFPPRGQDEMRPTTFNGQFLWSPDGMHIAIINQGDIWLVDTATGLAQQLTNDGEVSIIRWVE